jgi:hypothetical protein
MNERSSFREGRWWCPNFVVSIPSAAKAAQKHGVYGTAKAVPFQSKGKLGHYSEFPSLE